MIFLYWLSSLGRIAYCYYVITFDNLHVCEFRRSHCSTPSTAASLLGLTKEHNVYSVSDTTKHAIVTL